MTTKRRTDDAMANKRRTDDAMANERRTDGAMVKKKADRRCNDQEKNIMVDKISHIKLQIE